MKVVAGQAVEKATVVQAVGQGLDIALNSTIQGGTVRGRGDVVPRRGK